MANQISMTYNGSGYTVSRIPGVHSINNYCIRDSEDNYLCKIKCRSRDEKDVRGTAQAKLKAHFSKENTRAF